MTDHSELRRLAEAAVARGGYPCREYRLAVEDPARILALLDEIEALKREIDGWKQSVPGFATLEDTHD